MPNWRCAAAASLRAGLRIDQIDWQIVKMAQVACGECGAPRQYDSGDEGVADVDRTATPLASRGNLDSLTRGTGIELNYAVFQIVVPATAEAVAEPQTSHRCREVLPLCRAPAKIWWGGSIRFLQMRHHAQAELRTGPNANRGHCGKSRTRQSPKASGLTVLDKHRAPNRDGSPAQARQGPRDTGIARKRYPSAKARRKS